MAAKRGQGAYPGRWVVDAAEERREVGAGGKVPADRRERNGKFALSEQHRIVRARITQTGHGIEPSSVPPRGLNYLANGYETDSGLYWTPSQTFVGARFTFDNYLTCLKDEVLSVKDDLFALAEQLLGGVGFTLYKYITTGALKTLLQAAKAFATGTISWAAFWIALVASTTAVFLSDLLVAAGIGLGLAVLFGALKCAMP